MRKNELIDSIADQVGGRAVAGPLVDTIFDTIMRAVAAGESVEMDGFGTFGPRTHRAVHIAVGDSETIVGVGTFARRARGARTSRNIRTGATIKVKATSVPAFRPDQRFHDLVSEPTPGTSARG